MFKKLLKAVSGKKEAPAQKTTPTGRGNKAKQANQPARDTHNAKHTAHNAEGKKKKGKTTQSRKPEKPAVDDTPWSLDDFKVEKVEGQTRFHDLDLPDSVMRGIHKLGFSYCTPIQAEALPATLRGRDTIGQAQTGTGKSAAFLLTILNKLLTDVPEERYASEPRALVVAPTRELALQIGKDAEGLARYTGLNIVTIVGGMDYEKQRSQLRNHVVDLLVATPGRLIDFMRSQDVYLDQVEVLVLDEADRMLDMGFIPDVRRIVRATPPKEERQTLLFSATFNYDVRILIDQWTKDPMQVVIEPEQVATDRVEQRCYLLADSDKYKMLESVLSEEQPERCIVFANRRDLTRNLCDKLNKHGHKAVLLSGEVSQDKRIKTLERFRAGQVSIMVATDVAGRGIHVDGVSHVVNYTLPEDPEDYVHRIGRTGRAGAKGVSISFISEDDAFVLPDLEKYLGTKLELTQP
ncbi:ATP-dependent RNA helicase RhlB [Thalassolituus marinus]|uniref:ATP-dependent RNA helicase RhlB n=1 Tax=Thalassolituus marinus TaxID=671053 RepID=A0ABS7ZLM1_9GAMM|nr:ATP-dependent RNA helicase RhlB [Thalassolituus marinus]MCA6062605.1 ATP-dependent RNA helicase RhlB [Thalassolituus marinus]